MIIPCKARTFQFLSPYKCVTFSMNAALFSPPRLPPCGVPRCMGRSDGKRSAPCGFQTPCSPFRGLRRSGGTADPCSLYVRSLCVVPPDARAEEVPFFINWISPTAQKQEDKTLLHRNVRGIGIAFVFFISFSIPCGFGSLKDDSLLIVNAVITEADATKQTIPGGRHRPGTPWSEVPEDFECPLCGVGKDSFEEA